MTQLTVTRTGNVFSIVSRWIRRCDLVSAVARDDTRRGRIIGSTVRHEAVRERRACRAAITRIHPVSNPVPRSMSGDVWIKAGPIHVATIPRAFDGDWLPANARLIESAPELLEALDVMTCLCRLKYGNLDEDVYAEILKAEAAIRKATGE